MVSRWSLIKYGVAKNRSLIKISDTPHFQIFRHIFNLNFTFSRDCCKMMLTRRTSAVFKVRSAERYSPPSPISSGDKTGPIQLHGIAVYVYGTSYE